eukprot:jgi/Undpi1/6587/HiC_scaffold_20.g09066.m1
MSTRCWSAVTALLLLFLGLTTVKGATITIEPDGETIQSYEEPTPESALDRVEPGDTISITSGIYFQDLKTRVDGTENARITIQGVGGAENVIIRGTGEQSRVFQVQNDYITIKDFTIDGQAWDDVSDVTEDNAKQAYRDILIYVAVDRDATERSGGHTSALDGLVITGMIIQHALSECVRLRHIGTALSQWDEVKNYSGGEDICLGNVVRDNKIITNGNEGVDVKEGSLNTVIENNAISMQRDENAGGISSHADNTVIKGNTITNAAGAGVRVGTTVPDETGHFHGIDNTVIGNTMVDCDAYGLKIMSIPQGEICGNFVELPAGETEETYKYSGGTYGADFEPFDDCPGIVDDSPTPAPTLTPGAVYLGCFKDKKNYRTMETLAYKAKNQLTNETCIEHCRDEGFRFAGTTNAKHRLAVSRSAEAVIKQCQFLCALERTTLASPVTQPAFNALTLLVWS